MPTRVFSEEDLRPVSERLDLFFLVSGETDSGLLAFRDWDEVRVFSPVEHGPVGLSSVEERLDF